MICSRYPTSVLSLECPIITRPMSAPWAARIRCWSRPRLLGACAWVHTGVPVRACTLATAIASRSTSGVTDPGGHIALEQRLQRPVLVIEDLAPAAVVEREREVVVGVVAGRKHHLQPGALGRPGDQRRVAVQAGHGHVQDRADPGPAQPAEPLARGRYLGLGVPAPEAGPALLQGLGPDEHVLVHKHRAEIVDVDLPGGGRNVGHGVLPPVGATCHQAVWWQKMLLPG